MSHSYTHLLCIVYFAHCNVLRSLVLVQYGMMTFATYSLLPCPRMRLSDVWELVELVTRSSRTRSETSYQMDSHLKGFPFNCCIGIHIECSILVSGGCGQLPYVVDIPHKVDLYRRIHSMVTGM